MGSFWRDLVRGMTGLNFYLEYFSGYCMENGLEWVWESNSVPESRRQGSVPGGCDRKEEADRWEGQMCRIHKIWCCRRWGRGRPPHILAGPRPVESKWDGLQSCSLCRLCLRSCLDHFIHFFTLILLIIFIVNNIIAWCSMVIHLFSYLIFT